MELNGREIGFRRSILATTKIAEACPNHDLAKLGDALGGDIIVGMETAITFVCALSEAYELHRKREEPGYVPNPLTREELLDETEDTLMELVNEGVQVYMNDGKTTVEAEAPKGKNGEAASE